MSHITYEETFQIQVLLQEGYSHRKIAIILGKSNKTISNEVRNRSVNGEYRAEVAFQDRKNKRALTNSLMHCRILRGSPLDQYILEKLKLHWSPEQITGRWKKEHPGEKLSVKTVYNHIKRTHPKLAKQLFRRKMKPYKYGTIQASYIYDRVSISERPKEANNYEEFGHREADTMWGTGYKRGFVTLTERKSKMGLAHLVFGKDAKTTTEALNIMIEKMPKELRKTITFDNGTEFVNHFELKARYEIETFFCDPGRPGQRGLNENFNGLLREFAPKKHKGLQFTQKDVDKMIDFLNNRPRKIIDYCSPLEYLAENGIFMP